MSLAEAAERSGISEDRIRMYEDGERRPYGKSLRRLAEAYGVPVAEWLKDEVAARARGGRSGAAERRREPRRRRRRRVAPDQEAGRTVEVPVEVAPGQVVRVVIELIVRPKHPVPSVEVSTRAAPEAPPASPRRTEVPAGGSSGGVPGSAGASPPNGRSGGWARAEREDPMEDFRQAYRKFRQEKK